MDPIESIKKNYIYAQFSVIAINLFLLFIINFIVQKKETLIKGLKIIFLLSLISIIILIGIKISLDQTYTEEKFEEIFETEDFQNSSIYQINFSFNGIGITQETQKQVFINENLQAYHYFNFKILFGTILHGFVFLLNLYMLSKASKKINKKNQLLKDDLIVYDDETNVDV